MKVGDEVRINPDEGILEEYRGLKGTVVGFYDSGHVSVITEDGSLLMVRKS